MYKEILNSFLKNNDENISDIILSYLNICQKCNKDINEPLINIISFGNGKRHYYFKDLPGVNLEFKKFCNKCCSSKASSANIYIEI